MQGAEVGHHESGEAELAFEQVPTGGGVLAGVGAVDLVVGAHHRAQLGPLDHRLERERVDLVQGALVDDRVLPDVAVGLLVVAGVVLEGRDDVALLDRPHVRGHQLRVQDRVLARALGDPTEPGLTGDVGVRSEQDVLPGGADLVGHDAGEGAGLGGGPGGAEGDLGREGRRLAAGVRQGPTAGRDPGTGVGHLQRRDAEPRDGRVEEGVRPGLAGHQVDLLGQGHLGQQQPRPLGRCPVGGRPRVAGRRRRRISRDRRRAGQGQTDHQKSGCRTGEKPPCSRVTHPAYPLVDHTVRADAIGELIPREDLSFGRQRVGGADVMMPGSRIWRTDADSPHA